MKKFSDTGSGIKHYGLRLRNQCDFPALPDKLQYIGYQNTVIGFRFGPFFVEPIVAGLDPVTFEPYICNMDLIGCITEPVDFVAGGTCEEQLMGMCETLWEPNMGPEQLFECISQVKIF
jgi:20S proteasome alpha/beta subunit